LQLLEIALSCGNDLKSFIKIFAGIWQVLLTPTKETLKIFNKTFKAFLFQLHFLNDSFY
jgi:hypothetical protein